MENYLAGVGLRVNQFCHGICRCDGFHLTRSGPYCGISAKGAEQTDVGSDGGRHFSKSVSLLPKQKYTTEGLQRCLLPINKTRRDEDIHFD